MKFNTDKYLIVVRNPRLHGRNVMYELLWDMSASQSCFFPICFFLLSSVRFTHVRTHVVIIHAYTYQLKIAPSYILELLLPCITFLFFRGNVYFIPTNICESWPQTSIIRNSGYNNKKNSGNSTEGSHSPQTDKVERFEHQSGFDNFSSDVQSKLSCNSHKARN